MKDEGDSGEKNTWDMQFFYSTSHCFPSFFYTCILDMKQEVHCIVKPYKEAEKKYKWGKR